MSVVPLAGGFAHETIWGPDAMALIQSPLALLTVLAIAVTAAETLGRHRWGRRVGAALLVILIGALLANFRIIPPAGAGGPVYDEIFSVVAPGAIFLIMLEASLKTLRRAGGPMLLAFGLGAVATVIGVFAAVWLTPARAMLGDSLPAVAGMYAGTYIGGSANFNAIALHFGMLQQGGIYTAAVVADNVITGLWILVTLVMPGLLYRTGRFGRPGDRLRAVEETPDEAPNKTPVSALSGSLAIAAPLALALTAVAGSNLLAGWLAAHGLPIPSILILTTVALALAQIPAVASLTQTRALGLYAVYLFLAAVGASADVGALIAAGPTGMLLMVFVTILVIVHGLVLVAAGLVLKIEPEILAIASNANIGGGTSALSLAEALGREDLVLPAVIAGTVGTAIGTYVGFAVAAAL